jgi:hypothetical protein
MGKEVSSKQNTKNTKSNQKGGGVSCSSKFDYDSIKLGKNMKMSNVNIPPPPPMDCNIL